MSDAVLTNGAVISRESDDVPDTYEAVGKVVDFTPPNRTRAAVDVTHLGSTVKKSKPGIPDNGEFTFSVLYDQNDSGQEAVESDFESGEEKNYRLVLNDDTPVMFTFPAIVTAHQVTGGGIDSPVQATVTLKVNGAITRS